MGGPHLHGEHVGDPRAALLQGVRGLVYGLPEKQGGPPVITGTSLTYARYFIFTGIYQKVPGHITSKAKFVVKQIVAGTKNRIENKS